MWQAKNTILDNYLYLSFVFEVNGEEGLGLGQQRVSARYCFQVLSGVRLSESYKYRTYIWPYQRREGP